MIAKAIFSLFVFHLFGKEVDENCLNHSLGYLFFMYIFCKMCILANLICRNKAVFFLQYSIGIHIHVKPYCCLYISCLMLTLIVVPITEKLENYFYSNPS